MNFKYIFFTSILLFSVSLRSQIMPSNYGFSGGKSLIPAAKLDLNASNSRSYSGSGTTWTSIGNVQYNTTLVNNVTYVENGDFDYMSFDGSNDYVETGKTASNLNIYDADYTMEAAVRFDNTSQGMVFGTSTTSVRQGLHIGLGSSGRMYQGHYAADGYSANNTLTNDVWYHLMWTFDKSASEMKLYLDGSLIQTQTSKLSFLGTSNIMLGRYWAYSALDLAYARIYDTVLTSSQVSVLYNEYNSVVDTIVEDSLFLSVDASNSNSYSGSGTTWTDLTGNGYNGTLINGPTYDSNNSGSIVTDGSNDYVLFGPLPYVGTSSSNLTWELWVNPSDSDGNVMSMSNSNPQGGWNMPPIAASGSKFIAKKWNNNILYADNTYSQGTWYHVVLTWDYNNNTQSLYVNGVLNDSQSGINYSASGSNNYIFLGDDNPGANNTGMFGGKYGEFRIYNKSLSSSEVLNNYNSTKGRYGFTSPSPSSSDLDGSTSAKASSSAYAIKQAYPSSTDGIYWISNASINGGTPFQIYADMTTDGGGWMLIGSSGGSVGASEGSSVTSVDQRIYLPRSSVIILSQDASSVMLANGSSGNKTQNKIISTDDNPINVFRSSSTSYMGAGTFHYNNAYTSFSTNSGSTWQWNRLCSPSGSVTGWPFLYHACGNASGVHFMFSLSQSGGRNWNTGQWYSAWIR